MYEQARRLSRQSLFESQHDQHPTLLTFSSAPTEYQFIFNDLNDAFSKLEQAFLPLEELWTFLLDAVYRKQPRGYLIFEDQHKLLFRQEILEHSFVAEMLKDVARNYTQLQASMQGRPPSAFNLTQQQAILNDIGEAWVLLEGEISTSVSDITPATDAEPTKSHCLDNSGNVPADNSPRNSNESDQPLCTYEALREHHSLIYAGGNLCSLVTKFQKVGASPLCILQQVQKALKSSQLMADLRKADLGTIKTFLVRNVTAEKLLSDLLTATTKNTSLISKVNVSQFTTTATTSPRNHTESELKPYELSAE